MYTTSSPKIEGRGRIFEYAISLDYTPPQKVLLRLWHCMFTVTKVQTIASTVRGHHAWSPYIGEKSCHFNSRAITFTTPSLWPGILKNSNTVGQEPQNISWYFLRKSGSEVPCTVGINSDYSICMRDDLQSCASVG